MSRPAGCVSVACRTAARPAVQPSSRHRVMRDAEGLRDADSSGSLSGSVITVLNMNGFNDARPDRLPLSASVWDIAQRYDTGGPTVTEALYGALKELEAQVIALQRGEGEGLLS